MIPEDKSFKDELQRTIAGWREADRSVAASQQVINDVPIVSSLIELRYAARDILCSVDASLNGNISNETMKLLESAQDYLLDARQDVIDALVANADARITSIIIKVNGIELLDRYVPNFSERLLRLNRIKNNIAISRSDYTKRKSIYDKISYEDLLDLNRLISSVESLNASRERTAPVVIKNIGIVAIICLFGAAVGFAISGALK